MSGAIRKATTGLTGLAVAEYPHKALQVLYEKILKVVERMPAEAAYRRHTTAIVQERLGAVHSAGSLPGRQPAKILTMDIGMMEEEPNIEKLEKTINSGQIEEVILQAERELDLSRRMLEWRAWEPLVEQPPKNQWKWPI